jgi:hypothetical protein
LCARSTIKPAKRRQEISHLNEDFGSWNGEVVIDNLLGNGPGQNSSLCATILCGGGEGLSFAGARQGEGYGDDPDEAGEPCQGNQEEQLRADEMKNAELAARGEEQAENHDPAGDEF